ncbi:class I SAM-dependent methyltransferase [Zavarzinia compransoris]|uniref:Methyltransferase type 11 domain-containing protein n=1 Tax=Zavarzinia compransoris TaxID=1264899 RepID=A0A317E4D1_9PROT|nr:class I SAM-dependent methyltransferase [Zavarzinia compransoris]PWR21978.1 hypothetical protein DKG75_08340 [Zavarzinia compransoris]TDP47284.1 methyltransferase family protein [Zavarzinia compransoris]
MSGPHRLRCVETGALFAPQPGTLVHAPVGYPYPQMDGVPSLQTRARSAAELDAQIDAIRRGGRDAVLGWLAAWSARQGCRLDALRRVVTPGARGGFLADWAAYCGAADHYFLVRWACPSYLATLAFLDDMAGRRIACLASGVGHLSNLLRAVRPRPALTLLDGNLIHLLVARAYMAPGEQAICAELDDPLPLPDESFDLATMNDAFHYIDAKLSLLAEMRRIVTPDGAALILHIHDPRDLRGETVPGAPIAPVDFALLARQAGWRHCAFYAEAELAAGVVRHGAAFTPRPRAAADLPPGPYAVRLLKGEVSATRPWRLAAGRDGLRLNPIYRMSGDGRYRLDWRGSARNQLEFGHTPLPPDLAPDPAAADAGDLFRRGILVPDPDAHQHTKGETDDRP